MEPLVITMAREYASGGSEIAQRVADLLGVPLYNKELITPVSYTHLDVYKRQHHRRSILSACFWMSAYI